MPGLKGSRLPTSSIARWQGGRFMALPGSRASVGSSWERRTFLTSGEFPGHSRKAQSDLCHVLAMR
jgi:hypothetical protein